MLRFHPHTIAITSLILAIILPSLPILGTALANLPALETRLNITPGASALPALSAALHNINDLDADTPTPTGTATFTPSPSITVTSTPTRTATFTPSSSNIPTTTPTASATPTPLSPPPGDDYRVHLPIIVRHTASQAQARQPANGLQAIFNTLEQWVVEIFGEH
jgi:hypothetical protein